MSNCKQTYFIVKTFLQGNIEYDKSIMEKPCLNLDCSLGGTLTQEIKFIIHVQEEHGLFCQRNLLHINKSALFSFTKQMGYIQVKSDINKQKN